MAKDDVPPLDPSVVAELLDPGAGEREASRIADRLDAHRVAMGELDRAEAAAPPPPSDVAAYIDGVAVPQGSAQRVTETRVKVATDLRRMVAPPSIAGRATTRIAPVGDDRASVSGATSATAPASRRRLGLVACGVGVALLLLALLVSTGAERGAAPMEPTRSAPAASTAVDPVAARTTAPPSTTTVAAPATTPSTTGMSSAASVARPLPAPSTVPSPASPATTRPPASRPTSPAPPTTGVEPVFGLPP